MADTLALFARTFLIGIAVAAPVGAMGVLCIQRTLARGWRVGAATGLGIASADAAFAGLAAFGVAAVAQLLVTWQSPLRVVGGVVLVWLGVRAILAPPVHDAARASEGGGYWSAYASAVGLTLTNPMTIMAFGAVFATAGLSAEPTLSSAGVATLGVALGSLSWWLVLTTAVALMRHTVSDSAVRWVNRASGVAVALFGVVAIVAGVRDYL